jgi:hypothetical protein
MSYWFAGSVVVSGLVGAATQPGGDSSWKGQADKAGINTSAVMFQTARNFESLPGKARAIESQAALATVEVERNEAKSTSDAIVAAAASGAAGGSVDATIQQASISAGEAADQIETERLAGQAQVEQDRVDIFWEGDAAKYSYKYTGQKGGGGTQAVLGAIAGGVTAYFGAG